VPPSLPCCLPCFQAAAKTAADQAQALRSQLFNKAKAAKTADEQVEALRSELAHKNKTVQVGPVKGRGRRVRGARLGV
jgi:hypothetical protein